MKYFKLLSLIILGILILTTCKKPNTPPNADFTINPLEGNTDSVFTFDASLCSDDKDDQSTLQVHWDWENDGTWDTDFSTHKIIEHQYSEPGNYSIVLEVKDTKGLLTSKSKQIIVEEDTWETFTDIRDGKVYKIIKIGNQWWMAENLAYLPSVSPPTEGSDYEKHYYVYEYNDNNVPAAKSTDNYEIYGVLYNWEGAKTSCPVGWHLPSDAEWTILTDYLGGKEIAGGKMKEANIHWNPPNTEATNESSFSGFPGGYRHGSDLFNSIGKYGYWWSSTEYSSSKAWHRLLYYTKGSVGRGYPPKHHGISVRCLRD